MSNTFFKKSNTKTGVRFTTFIEKPLMEKFDQTIKKIGYTSRSEAIKDLMRDFLIKERWRSGKGKVFAILTAVYNHHKRQLSEKLLSIQHRNLANIISTMHIHIDHENCLEVIAMRGKARALKRARDEIMSLKNVKDVELVITGED